jgi:hypothetical protein
MLWFINFGRNLTYLQLISTEPNCRYLIRVLSIEDYEVAVVPKRARAILSRFDERSQHYEIRAERGAGGY